jgi:HAE1 family hydrophobic/amphiphilic exporter-1
MKGSGEIGFTVMAITFSLIAVFIPLFLMSGYVGLLFREFAIAVSAALVLSLIISRTLTPMMCAYVLKPASKQHGWLYRLSERGFDGLLYVYEAGLKIVLRHRFMTMMVMLGTIALTGYLYVIIPKGFFPQQDTGLIIAQSEAAQDISFAAMRERQQALQDAIMRDPAVASVGSAVGAGGGLYTLNDGRVFIQLKPHGQRDPIDQVMARLRTNLARIQGITLYMQAAQDITIGARLNKTQFQYTLNDADPGELDHWATLFLDKFRAIPGVVDVATDQLNTAPMLDVKIKREVASSYGILP